MIDADGYYECSAFFNPISKKIELGIGGNENGPTKEARLFYTKIERDYLKLIEIMKPLIQEELKNWRPEIEIADFQKEFEPCSSTTTTKSRALVCTSRCRYKKPSPYLVPYISAKEDNFSKISTRRRVNERQYFL